MSFLKVCANSVSHSGNAKQRKIKFALPRGTPTRGSMVTANGVRHNAAWNDIQSEVTLEDLFKD
jgi:hypothetical protein